MSFIFYDTETTGTETFFDQILQFAAIRTDDELRETDRFEVRCRLQSHIVPSPEAMRICGTPVGRLGDPALPSHYQMIRQLRTRLVGWSPALFVGWNSIRFDEALLRQALYQTLHPPYLTNTNRNSRSDAMRLVQASSAHAPGALVLPIDLEGKATFRLAAIAAANGFRCNRAHDAMADTEATVHLCRILAQQAPDLWSSFMRFSTKAAVLDFIKTEPVFGVTNYFGRAYSRLVTAIAPTPDNPAEWYVYDLAIDPTELQELSDEELQIRLEDHPKPVRGLKANESPSLFTFDNAPECCAARLHELSELERRAAQVSKDSDLGQRLMAAMAKSRPKYPAGEHVEQQIYAGFPSREDDALMESFHQAPWEQRRSIVDRFSDRRLTKLGLRLLHAERPDLLHRSTCDDHDLEFAQRLLGTDAPVPWLTLSQALTQLEGQLTSASAEEVILLRDHATMLRNRHNQARARVEASQRSPQLR